MASWVACPGVRPGRQVGGRCPELVGGHARVHVRLEPITESEFPEFLEALLPPYAQARSVADHQTLADAEAFARRQHEALLPLGFATPGHHFLRVVDEAQGQRVGSLWLFLDTEGGEAFVYDITISEGSRRRGLASAAMGRVEARAREAGCRRISLNVFAPNRAAQALYRKLGYAFVSHHMNKRL